jgi:hypothetical protein
MHPTIPTPEKTNKRQVRAAKQLFALQGYTVICFSEVWKYLESEDLHLLGCNVV